MKQNFEYWVFLALFSLVNLTSLNNSFVENTAKDWSTEQKWVMSVAAISLILSVMACAFHLTVHEKFCGKAPEGCMVRVIPNTVCAGLALHIMLVSDTSLARRHCPLVVTL